MQSTPVHTTLLPGTYDIDPERTAIRFRTRHMFGLGPVRGTFAVRSGAVGVTDPLAGSAVYAEIEAASFRTGNPARDRMVRQAKFLDAASYPLITFAGRDADPESGTINGTLTVRGADRPVTLVVTSAGQAGADLMVTGSMHVDRFDFGLTAMRGLAGRYLELELSAVCVARQAGQDGTGQDEGRRDV
jgi:polyisoprenoid-binding protein YceI